MSKKLSLRLIILTIVLSTLLTACSGGSNEAEDVTNNNDSSSNVVESTTPKDEGEGILKEATIEKLGSANPHIYTSTYQSSVIGRTGSTLYAYLPNDDFTSYELKGELADGQPEMVDEEGKVWKIKLKEDMKWANGDTLDAEDVMYTWKAIIDPKLVNPRGGQFASDYITIVNAGQYYLQNTEGGVQTQWEEVGLKQPDNLTLEVTTVSSHSAEEVMNHFAHPCQAIVYDVYYEEFMNADRTETLYGSDVDKYMSSGKFILDNWVTDSILVYKKNPNYVYKDLIWLAGIESKVVADQGTQMQLFENGEIDKIKLSPEDYLKYEQDPRVLYEPASSVTSLTFNTINPEKPILANVNFRKAVYHAVNREAISKLTKTTPANYTVSSRLVIDPMTGLRYRDTEAAQKLITPNLGYDPELAKQLFNKALEEEGLDKVEITILYNDTDTYRVMTEYFQKSVPEILGEDKLTFKLQAMPTTQLNDLKKTFNQNPTVYEMTWSSWAPNELAPWNGMKYWEGSYNRKNEPFYNEEFDRYYEEANSGEHRFEEGVRLDLTAKMEEVLLREMPFVPVMEGLEKYLKSERLVLPFDKWINKITFGWDYSRIVE